MYFKTDIEPRLSEFPIKFGAKILTLGSCFSEVIGSFFNKNKFNCLTNPFGNIYNLKSLLNVLEVALKIKELDVSKIIERENTFYHLDYHSEVCGLSKEDLILHIKEINNAVFEQLKSTDYLFITLGTSWVYKQITTNQTVSNCHKLPANIFTKEILDLEEQKSVFKKLHYILTEVNPSLKIIVTVSPVRHIKDKIEQNSVSKAILRLVCNFACKEFQNMEYFPSYEIMMDDLRDYRYYKADLIHPNEIAETYIIEKFKERYFNENELLLLKKWDNIRSGLNHRPFNPKSNSHQTFLKNLMIKLVSFETYFDVSVEKEIIQNQLLSEA